MRFGVWGVSFTGYKGLGCKVQDIVFRGWVCQGINGLGPKC